MTQRLALVTGATGGLGRHLIKKLVQSGYKVRASGRNQTVGNELTHEHSPKDLEFAPGDLRNHDHAKALTRDSDVIFHCAALSAPWGKRDDFQTANVDVTRSLIEAALTNGCQRFVHVSSSSIYFDFKDRLEIREDAALSTRFANHYAATKAEAEKVVQSASSNNAGLLTNILRPRAIFGEHDAALVPRLLKVARTGTMPIFRNGQAIVDVTYAGNVADAMLLCDTPSAPTGTFNITNGEPIKVRDLLERVFRTLELDVKLVRAPYNILYALAGGWELTSKTLGLTSEPKLLRYSLGLMNYSQTLDISKATTQLGYVPQVSIDQGLKRFAHWHRKNNANPPSNSSLTTKAGQS